MALRSQKTVGVLVAWMLAGAAWGAAPELRYKVRHDHLWKGGSGLLVVTPKGIVFEEPGKRPHAWHWEWHDIQQLTVAPRHLTVLTYQDNRWRLGADREYRFVLVSGDDDFSTVYRMLKERLDQRLVAALPDRSDDALWRIPAKHLLRFGGCHGTLTAAPEGLVFEADRKGESRTWRWQDIDNVSRTGPFQLTITTYERARSHYGSRKGFNFQLKEALSEARYNDLWRRVHAADDLPILQTEREEQP